MKRCPKCEKSYDRTVEFCPSDGAPLVLVSKPKPDPLLEKVLAGRYRLIEKIGEGGMGSVYKAVHLQMERACAIKLLAPTSTDSEASLARFNREARMASRIDNPHAVTIYDFGEAEGGMLYLAMEYVEGKQLTRLISEHGKLDATRAANIAAQISEALSAAHALGIVHRDLKPDNIMVTRKGAEPDYVKVLDFGIAKSVVEEGGDNLTKTGFVLGTPAYMSPEQLSGDRVDARSDVYSLAIIVYEMLSGRLPFEGENPQAIMVKRLMSDPIPLRTAAPTVTDSIEQAVMDALARNKDSRTPTTETFANALKAAVQVGTQALNIRVTSSFMDEVAPKGTQEWVTMNESQVPGVQPPNTVAFQAEPAEDAGLPSQSRPSLVQAAPFDAAPAGPIPSPRGEQLTLEENLPAPASRIVSGKQAIGQAEAGKRRGLIAASAVLVIAALAAILYFALGGGPRGFTVVVSGAPPGSEVFVNNSRRGVTGTDGTLRIEGQEAGELAIRVARSGFSDFLTTVSGREGEEKIIESDMLPSIVEYSGKMILIPAGEFFMGDDNHEPDEAPGHMVALPSFYIDKFEVTNAQYKKFCDETGRPFPSNAWDPGYFTGNPDSPVVGVSWDDAMSYASWAGKRLPTEQEWEKAASWDQSTLTKLTWPWGKEPGQGNANLNRDPHKPQFAVVGSYARDASPYGVMDMGGNAAEWVDSYYLPYEGNRQANPDFGNRFKVVRGGTSINKESDARTTYRQYQPWQANPKGLIGFRCAVSADNPRLREHLRNGGRQ